MASARDPSLVSEELILTEEQWIQDTRGGITKPHRVDEFWPNSIVTAAPEPVVWRKPPSLLLENR